LTIKLFSVKGQLLKQGYLLKVNSTLNISMLSKVIYFILGKSIDGKTIAAKFIKK